MAPRGRATQQSRDTKQTIKATRSLYPLKMIAKLEWTQGNASQNMKKNRTMRATTNSELTTTEPPP